MSITSETDRVITACARAYIERGETGTPRISDAIHWWGTLTAEERQLFDGAEDLRVCVQHRVWRLAEGAA